MTRINKCPSPSINHHLKAQIKCFTAFRRFQPACTPFSCGHIWYQTLWKEACTFPHASSLQLLTDGAWHGTGAPPLIRSALSISCREIEFEFEIITDCSICWCKCDGRSDYLLLFEIFYAVGGERGKLQTDPPQTLVGWQARGFAHSTDIQLRGLSVRAVLYKDGRKRGARDPH